MLADVAVSRASGTRGVRFLGFTDRGNHSAVDEGAKSLVDDLGMDRGVVPSRAAVSLRSAETNPSDPRDLSAFAYFWTDKFSRLRQNTNLFPPSFNRGEEGST